MIIMILNKEAIRYISKQLSLPFDESVQDWDLELSNSKRINEFILYNEKESLSKEQKIVLMAIILASFNDLLKQKTEIDEQYLVNLWEQIRHALEKEIFYFRDLLIYWGYNQQNNQYAITPYINKLEVEI